MYAVNMSELKNENPYRVRETTDGFLTNILALFRHRDPPKRSALLQKQEPKKRENPKKNLKTQEENAKEILKTLNSYETRYHLASGYALSIGRRRDFLLTGRRNKDAHKKIQEKNRVFDESTVRCVSTLFKILYRVYCIVYKVSRWCLFSPALSDAVLAVFDVQKTFKGPSLEPPTL